MMIYQDVFTIKEGVVGMLISNSGSVPCFNFYSNNSGRVMNLAFSPIYGLKSSADIVP